MHLEALIYVTIAIYRRSSRSSISVTLSRVVLWDMEQQYQDTMTLTWLSTLEVGNIVIQNYNDDKTNIVLCMSL